ncbi:hypothetical protein GGF45_005937, partial [Coemansia sp. RSA 551]
MNSSYNPVYQQVIERTRNLVFRTQVMNSSIDKNSNPNKKDDAKQKGKQPRAAKRQETAAAA